MTDAVRRTLERDAAQGDDSALDRLDREQLRAREVGPARQDAYQLLLAALIHRLSKTGDVIFWKDKPSPIPTNKLDVYLNHQRIWPTRTVHDVARVRESLREILNKKQLSFPPLVPLGSQLRELVRRQIANPVFAPSPFIDSDADGQGYILENVGGGLLFAPWGWEPTAGDLIEVRGPPIADTDNNTAETIARLELHMKLLTWVCRYGMIEIEFTLTPNGAVEDVQPGPRTDIPEEALKVTVRDQPDPATRETIARWHRQIYADTPGLAGPDPQPPAGPDYPLGDGWDVIP